MVAQSLFKPNGSRLWCLMPCLSQTGQGLRASRLVWAKRFKVLVAQSWFKPNGSRFWCLRACLSQTGQGFRASRPVQAKRVKVLGPQGLFKPNGSRLWCVHQGLFKGFGASRQAGQSFGSEGLFPLATSTVYIGEFKPNGSDFSFSKSSGSLSSRTPARQDF